jgi:hypothetical protein
MTTGDRSVDHRFFFCWTALWRIGFPSDGQAGSFSNKSSIRLAAMRLGCCASATAREVEEANGSEPLRFTPFAPEIEQSSGSVAEKP